MMMDVPPVYRKRRAKAKPPRQQPAVAGPVLVSAAYESTAALVLTFDRAVDIAGFDGAAIVVDDGSAQSRYAGTGGATLVGPATVEIVLVGVGDWFEPGVTMTASAANGIVAAEGGAAWAGVAGLELPWP